MTPLDYLNLDGWPFAVPSNSPAAAAPNVAAGVQLYRCTRAGITITAAMTPERAEAHLAAGRVCVPVVAR